MMKIYIRDIPEEGLRLEKTPNCEEIGLSDDNFKCLSPLTIKARVEKADDAVLAKVQVKGEYEFACSRCTEPVRQDRTDRLDLYFDVTPETEFVDLSEDIRQEMLLTLSEIVLCQERCRGLCPDCGVNLNKEKCRCEKKKEQKAGGLFGRADKQIKIK